MTSTTIPSRNPIRRKRREQPDESSQMASTSPLLPRSSLSSVLTSMSDPSYPQLLCREPRNRLERFEIETRSQLERAILLRLASLSIGQNPPSNGITPEGAAP